MAQTAPILTEVERIARYREMAGQFRKWAESETNGEARAGLLEVAQQYSSSSLAAVPLPVSLLVENTKCLPSCWTVPTIISGLPIGPARGERTDCR